MEKLIDFQPNWASAPGNTINDVLRERNLSLSSFAQRMNTTQEFIDSLLNGNISITTKIASQLATILGASEEFWINRELQFNEDSNRIKAAEESVWLKELPINDMVRFGWIDNLNDKVTACLNYFNVPDIKTWRLKYNNLLEEVAFKTSPSFKSENGSVATWLRRGEILGSEIDCAEWNEKLFEETLEKIKLLTRKKNPKDFIPELVRACAECGVAVAIVRTPSGCRASGATRFISPQKALLILSFRYLSDDQFWFSFFHEAGHLVLHNHKLTFIEPIKDKMDSIEETEADIFASEMLVPYDLQSELASMQRNKRNIINFAIKAGVSPGIVVGQLQHYKYIDFKYLNSYKRRYDLGEILELT